MTWVRIDDKAWCHPKLNDLPPAALRLWIFSLCWSAQQETDGHVPRTALRLLGGSTKSSDRLVSAGLWERVADGWLIHDFLVYQPSKSQLEEKRARVRERVTAHRERARNTVTGSAGNPVTNIGVTPPPSRPVPSRPDLPVDVDSRPPGQILAERAAFCLRDHCAGDYEKPQNWPEVRKVARAFTAATGVVDAQRLGGVARDSGLRAILGLFAAGWSAEEICERLPDVVASDWWRSGNRGLGSLSPEVIRRSGPDPIEPQPDPEATARRERDEQRAKAAIERERAKLRQAREARSGPEPTESQARDFVRRTIRGTT